MRLRWSAASLRDLRRIRALIERENPTAARTVARRIFARVEALREHPALGRPGRLAGTRELVVAGLPYLVMYRARGDTIIVLRALHGSRQWPESLEAG